MKRPPPLFVASAEFVPVSPRLSEEDLSLVRLIANKNARCRAPASEIPPYEARPKRIRKLAEATAVVALGKGGGDGSVPSWARSILFGDAQCCLVTLSITNNFSGPLLPLRKAAVGASHAGTATSVPSFL